MSESANRQIGESANRRIGESANPQPKTLNPQPITRKLKSSDLKIMLRCFGYLRPSWKLMVGAYLTMLIISALGVANPQLLRWGIDRGIKAGDMGVLGWAVLGVLGLTLLNGVLSFFQGRWTELASQQVAYDMRNDIHRKLSTLSFAYHDQAETGQLLSRAIQDVDRIRFMTGRATLHLINGVITFFATTAMMLTMNPRLTLLAMLTTPLLFYQTFTFARKIRPMWLALQQQMAILTTRLEQNLRGMRIVKGFAQEPAETARFEAENATWFQIAANSARLQSINGPLMGLITNIGSIFILWYGGRLVIEGGLTLGELVAFTAYMGQLAGPVRMLGRVIPAIVQAIACGERIFDILDAESEVKESPDAIVLPEVRGHVRFENVSFAYFGRHKVLENVTLDVPPGQIVALLGATGSGKTTIINLIPRFYDVTAGRVTVDDYDIRDVTLNSLRAQIGIVLQETTLFADTIRANIAFGRPDATEDEIVAAAQAAQAHDFILEMPEGYDTKVGERGVTLSGGQKQRIAIARALLKDPRILILDDAMSSVDTETEQLIQMALERLMRGRTSFVIAQRLSTVRLADQILVLEHGHIVAQGTHEELLHTSGLYVEIYQRQLRPQEVAEIKRRQEAGSQKLEARSWKLEAGSRKLEVGSPKLETGSSQPASSIQHPVSSMEVVR
ncbi:MAG TPA: ABC transporter ATP-binding protein [Anaerolineae bacterium]|nr:ABC transporter ATP-binding protein [Anaerolineae bacterium]HQI85341.1 ABC transporter ATP-binding protein [Anaerolineae bacterium]